MSDTNITIEKPHDENRGLAKLSLKNLSKRAGIKLLSNDCVPLLRSFMDVKLNEFALIMNAIIQQKGTKIITDSDVYNAFALMKLNIARSDEF